MDGMAAGPFPIARSYSSGMRGRPIAKIGQDGFVKTPKCLADRGSHRRPVRHIVFAKEQDRSGVVKARRRRRQANAN